MLAHLPHCHPAPASAHRSTDWHCRSLIITLSILGRPRCWRDTRKAAASSAAPEERPGPLGALPVELLGDQVSRDLHRPTNRPGAPERAEATPDRLGVVALAQLVQDRRDALGVV